MKIVIVLCAIVALAASEKPAPYPPSGWKPQGARLELPARQYGPPPSEVEFTTVINEYLPPTTTDVPSDEDDTLRVQGLPAAESVSEFKQFQRTRPANVKARPFLLNPLFAPQFGPVSGQLREQKFGRLEFEPEVNVRKNVQRLPQRAYGPPQDVPASEAPQNEPETPQDEPEVEQDEPEIRQNEQPQSQPEQPQNDNDYDEDQDESDEPIIAVSNADTTGSLVQQTQQGQLGQYYVLLPDNSLQKVRFATRQTEEDRQINGFSAQLRYSPVEAIRDPVYGYDEQGKLVRLYK